MGLFSFKKKVSVEKKLPEFPRFPAEHASALQMAEFPAYDPSFAAAQSSAARPGIVPSSTGMMAQQVEKPQPPVQGPSLQTPVGVRVDIPQREPAFLRQEPVYPERQGVAPRPNPFQSAVQEPVWRPPSRLVPEEKVVAVPSGGGVQQQVVEEKPVFVKIQQYREAMAGIEGLKQKLKETEYLLAKLEEIRSHEQAELASCQENLNRIKAQLVEIDKKLFEV